MEEWHGRNEQNFKCFESVAPTGQVIKDRLVEGVFPVHSFWVDIGQIELFKATIGNVLLIGEESKHLVHDLNLGFLDSVDLDLRDGLILFNLCEDGMLQDVGLPFGASLVNFFIIDIDPPWDCLYLLVF